MATGADAPENDDGAIDMVRYTRALAEDAGFDEFYVVRRETVKEVLTDERLRIVETLRERDVQSISALARALDRDKGAVKRDLDVLFHHDIVAYERDGRAKAPRLKHEHVFVEPVYLGEP